LQNNLKENCINPLDIVKEKVIYNQNLDKLKEFRMKNTTHNENNKIIENTTLKTKSKSKTKSKPEK